MAAGAPPSARSAATSSRAAPAAGAAPAPGASWARGADHDRDLAARRVLLVILDQLPDRSPPHLLVQLGQLARHRRRPVRRRSAPPGPAAGRRCGPAPRSRSWSRARSRSARAARRASSPSSAGSRGRGSGRRGTPRPRAPPAPPRAPGSARPARPRACARSATNAPGSDTPGVPASVTYATSVARLHAVQQPLDRLRPAVRVQADERRRHLVVAQEPAGPPRVFRRDHRHLPQHLQAPKRKIPQMTDGGAQHVQRPASHHWMRHGSFSKNPTAFSAKRCSRAASRRMRGALCGCEHLHLGEQLPGPGGDAVGQDHRLDDRGPPVAASRVAAHPLEHLVLRQQALPHPLGPLGALPRGLALDQVGSGPRL